MKSLARKFLERYQKLHEKSLGRVYQHFNSGEPVAIVSACRGELPQDEMEEFYGKFGEDRNKWDDKVKRMFKIELARFNNANTRKLRQMIQSQKFGFVPVKGGYVETHEDGSTERVTEDSSIIFSTPEREKELRKFAIKLGNTFSQDSIFFLQTDRKSYWIFTREHIDWQGIDRKIGDVEPCGEFHATRLGSYFTQVGKKDFSFAEV